MDLQAGAFARAKFWSREYSEMHFSENSAFSDSIEYPHIH
jgi:hemerythrin